MLCIFILYIIYNRNQNKSMKELELELEKEIENLNMILSDLERKKKEKEHLTDQLSEELKLIINEIDNLNKYIKDKLEEKKAWEKEQEVQIHYDDINIFGKWDYNVATATAISSVAPSFAPKIVNARLIPVNNDGEPIEPLGEGKWTKKN